MSRLLITGKTNQAEEQQWFSILEDTGNHEERTPIPNDEGITKTVELGNRPE